MNRITHRKWLLNVFKSSSCSFKKTKNENAKKKIFAGNYHAHT